MARYYGDTTPSFQGRLQSPPMWMYSLHTWVNLVENSCEMWREKHFRRLIGTFQTWNQSYKKTRESNCGNISVIFQGQVQITL